MNTSELFNANLTRLLKMKKKDIVAESVERGFTDERSAEYKVQKSTKNALARELADKIVRMETRGY